MNSNRNGSKFPKRYAPVIFKCERMLPAVHELVDLLLKVDVHPGSWFMKESAKFLKTHYLIAVIEYSSNGKAKLQFRLILELCDWRYVKDLVTEQFVNGRLYSRVSFSLADKVALEELMAHLDYPFPFRHRGHASLVPQIADAIPVSSMPVGMLETDAARRIGMKQEAKEKILLPQHRFEDVDLRKSVAEAIAGKSELVSA